MQEERHGGNLPAFLGFAVAFTFDVLDVLAHVVVVVGLLHHHFQVGLHVPHHVLHAVEGAGIGIAVVSTVAAAAAEILAMRRVQALADAAAAATAAAAGKASHAAAAVPTGGKAGVASVDEAGAGAAAPAPKAPRAMVTVSWHDAAAAAAAKPVALQPEGAKAQ